MSAVSSSAPAAPDAPAADFVELIGISKRYPTGVEALAPSDLTIGKGEFITIVGPSGCGKSTLLRILAGLMTASAGSVVRPAKMKAAFVFQEAALLPWLTVRRNAELLMELENFPPPSTRAWQASQALKLVGLEKFETAYPHQLSGGMKMRLSLARSIALEPDLLLLDEPLAAVDELTRETLQVELSQLWRTAGFSAVLVTHSVEEAVFLSKRVVVMSPRPGRIVDVLDIDLPFPRTDAVRQSPEFAHHVARATLALRQDREGAAHAE